MKRPPLWLGLFFVSLALRILAITVPINTDEVKWMSRGSDFARELLKGDLADTYLKHHPGVPNMWLIGSSMVGNCLLHQLFPGWLSLNGVSDLEACLKINPFPIALYVLPRLLQAVVTSGCMVYLYKLIQQLLGKPIALCSLTLLLLEPFFLAYQRFLTTDALLIDFSILALLLFLLYLRGDGGRRSLVLSGVLMGLATAAKVTALVMLPAVVSWVVLIELGVWKTNPPKGWKQQSRDLILWGATLIVTIFVIWPALWAAPIETLAQLYQGLLEESARGDFFFLGQNTDSPGLLFYPLVLAYRLSPVVQVGLLAFGAVLLIPKLRHKQKNIPELVALALVPLFVLLFLSAVESKIDRYINLAVPVLTLLAAVGWLEIAAWVQALWQRRINPEVTTATLLATLQLIILVPHYPYYLTYYNPLLGGARVAQHLFMVGQGEGLDLAAQWLNQSPQAQEMSVASWVRSSFAPYFHGQTLRIDKSVKSGLQPWTQANRVVLYYNQFQRQLPEPRMIAYFAQQQPLHTVRLHDIDYVRIYPGPVPLPEDLKRIPTPLSVSFGQQVRLLGYELNQPQLSVGKQQGVTLYWEFLAPLPPDAMIQISLVDEGGKRWNLSQASPLDGYLPGNQITPGTFLRDVHQLTVPPRTPLGRYHLEVGWKPSSGQALTVDNAKGTAQMIAEVEVIRSAE